MQRSGRLGRRLLKIKISGCFNSCGQHHVADIGFYGVTRKIDGHSVPHFQLVLGGQWTENAGSFGLAMMAIPSKNVPTALSRITDHYVETRVEGETFQAFIARIGKVKVRKLLDDLTKVPPHAEAPEFYTDWGDPRRYSLGDLGKGECAGEMVSPTEFGLAAAEREVFEAQLHLDDNRPVDAARTAYKAMVTAARALIEARELHVTEDPDVVVDEFRAKFLDTKLFFDPFAGGKFGSYLVKVHANKGFEHVGLDGGSPEGGGSPAVHRSGPWVLSSPRPSGLKTMEAQKRYPLEAHKCALKIYVKAPGEVDLGAFVPIFHRWIQQGELPGLLLDVADYSHVPSGPGIMLIGHEADLSLDLRDGRAGLLYTKKRGQPRSMTDNLRGIFRSTFAAAKKLEAESTLAGKLGFDTGELLFRINDRLLAPNTDETFGAVEPILSDFVAALYGQDSASVTHDEEVRSLFGARIRAASAPGLAHLLEKL